MIRMLGVGLLLAGLGGCATMADDAWWRDLAGLSSGPGVYHFDWRMAGDPALAPLQVFDDGRNTWLQYPTDQPVPAIFERTARGDRLRRPRRQGDYLILHGVPDRIVMRGGLSQAETWRTSDPSPVPGATPSMSALAELDEVGSGGAVQAMGAGDEPAMGLPVTATVAHLPVPVPQPALPPPPSPPAPQRVDIAPSPTAAASMSMPVRGHATSFEVTPADGNVRRALGRWAQSAGWTFEPEHWDVDVDIPLAGSAVFGDSFRTAVSGLLSATELGDRPVQPCFYANRVLRVVPLAQRCDRTRAPGVDS